MATQEWKDAYRRLLKAFTDRGYPEEFAEEVAKNLGSVNTMTRMTRYMYAVKGASVEDIADEMLAIAADRDRWVGKKKTEAANREINMYLNSDLGEFYEDSE